MAEVHTHWSAGREACNMPHLPSIAGSCLVQGLHLTVDIAHPLQRVTGQRIHLQAAVGSGGQRWAGANCMSLPGNSVSSLAEHFISSSPAPLLCTLQDTVEQASRCLHPA